MNKIIFTDLDGTLLNKNHQVSPKNKNSIRQALQQGHKIVIASGRPLASVKLLARELELDGKGCFAIASNGAVLYDCEREQILRQNTIPRQCLLPMFRSAHQDNLHIHTYTATHVICEEDRPEIHWYEKEIRVPALIVDDVRKYVTFDPVKILVLNLENKQRLIDFQQKMLPYTADKMETLFSSNFILEYFPLGASKGNSVKELCQLLKLPLESSIAVGDAENDISMIEAAHIGCCMKNGFDNVKQRADYVTKADNNHDGFAEILETFVL